MSFLAFSMCLAATAIQIKLVIYSFSSVSEGGGGDNLHRPSPIVMLILPSFGFYAFSWVSFLGWVLLSAAILAVMVECAFMIGRRGLPMYKGILSAGMYCYSIGYGGLLGLVVA
ncbi:hypothetical protein IC757_05010 [Wenzhouxiangella sp. AB-CW3]|uniref:hypothetical protein n=1 Tax=Wenzhouxiangella sp. AB-CW3 TaxID=2771012 RepID=UPI00168BC6F0|nr:hypothetical protein [Wenzhouxiangella sp. AB-CW3]QOC23503.1 hypothetical protein IC757_05010 [Wenzhouxiangella sp. AB-CW3]